MEVIDAFRQQFKDASGEGAALELSMRLLADKVPGMDAYGTLESVEAQIGEIFDAHLTFEDRQTLTLVTPRPSPARQRSPIPSPCVQEDEHGQSRGVSGSG